jgi:hypothetical protein
MEEIEDTIKEMTKKGIMEVFIIDVRHFIM